MAVLPICSLPFSYTGHRGARRGVVQQLTWHWAAAGDCGDPPHKNCGQSYLVAEAGPGTVTSSILTILMDTT